MVNVFHRLVAQTQKWEMAGMLTHTRGLATLVQELHGSLL